MLRHTLDDYIEENGRVFHELVHNKEVSVVGMENGWQVTTEFSVNGVRLLFGGEVRRVEHKLHIGQEKIFTISCFCQKVNDVDDKTNDIQTDFFTGCVH